mgnify:CR=1 FL=1
MPIVSDEELQRRRGEIIDAARVCFAHYGYEGATVARLEEATGKTRGAIFHHFGDKETLFLAIAEADAEEAVLSSGVLAQLVEAIPQATFTVVGSPASAPLRAAWLSPT